MSLDRYGRGMAGRRWIGGTALVAVLLASCGDDDASDVTLGPLDATAGATVPGASQGTGGQAGGPTTTTIDPAVAGSGAVSIQVRLPASGIDETLVLDRASLPATSLDPVSLDASCTPLDGGTEMAVSVVDLRRLAAGSRLVSAALSVDGGMVAGEHEATLDVSGADQVTTTFTGNAVLAEGGLSGTFEATDGDGNAATGSFSCSAEALVTTTTLVAGSGEEVPGSSPTS